MLTTKLSFVWSILVSVVALILVEPCIEDPAENRVFFDCLSGNGVEIGHIVDCGIFSLSSAADWSSSTLASNLASTVVFGVPKLA